jgi:ferredoxin
VVRDLFLAFLAPTDDATWLRLIDRLEASLHPVDRAATRIWFHLYPLALQRAMELPNAADLARRMTLAGRWKLADQIDTSHRFLYGHRFWEPVRRAAIEHVDATDAPGSLDLGAQVHAIARRAAAAASVDEAIVLGISAVALRTLQQVGPDRMAGPSQPVLERLTAASPEAVLRQRERRSTGMFGLLRRAGRAEVVFDEHNQDARFPLIPSQHLTTAAALDRRPWRDSDARCSEGPIPVQCRSCSCGTCWIGVLAGADRLSPVDDRERDKLRECGVVVEGSHPVVRLSCMAQAFAPTTIVIPPWNGLVGRVIKAAH